MFSILSIHTATQKYFQALYYLQFSLPRYSTMLEVQTHAPSSLTGPTSSYTFQGWMGLDEKSIEGNMEWREFEPKKFDEERDVDIQITHCGVCGSDLHTLRSGWVRGFLPFLFGIGGRSCCMKMIGRGKRIQYMADMLHVVGPDAVSRCCWT